MQTAGSIIAAAAAAPRIHLQGVDQVVIGSYFVVLLVIGLYYRRFASQSMEDYFLAGRRNSGWANGVSYAAALMNADVAPAYSGIVVATGLFVCWFYLSRFGLALFLGAMLFAVFWRRLRLFTTPEFYELRFGGLASNVIRAWVALRSSLIAMVAWTGTGLIAIYKIAGPVLGVSKTAAILMVVPIVLLYVAVAGLSGVVATAGVQSIIMVVGSAMLCGIVLYMMGGPAMLAVQLQQVAGDQALQALPPTDHWFFPLAAAIALMIGTSVGYGGDTAPLGGAMEGQLVLSSRNAREASKMYLVAEVTLFVLLLLVTLPSLGAIVKWPELRNPAADREEAYGRLMSEYLPPGMLGLLFVVMLAAVMSTIGSNLIFGAQVLVNDVYRRYLRPQAGERHCLWIGRAAAMLILLLAIVVAYKVKLIFDVAAFMITASAAELPANWAQWWWWRFNRWGRIAASLGAILLTALIWYVLPTRDWLWWNRTYLAIAANTLLWVVVTLVTAPDSPAVLERFYRRARPLGWWGPVRKRLEASGSTDAAAPSASGIGLILAGLGLAVTGAGAVMLLTVGLSALYLGRFVPGAVQLIGAAVAGGAFLSLYGPYLDRLEAWGGSTPEHAPDQRPETAAGAGEPESARPAPTSVVVALATTAYGIVVIFVGLFATQGTDRVFNVVAGVAFLISALLVWRVGREPPNAVAVPAKEAAAV